MPRSLTFALTAACLVVATANAHAEVCAVTSVTAVSFGGYNVFDSAPVVAAGGLTYECTSVGASDVVVIEIDGLGDPSGFRSMTSGSHVLRYQLYLDAARLQTWGTGSGGTSVYGPTAPVEGVPTVVPIYGRIPARQDAAAGTYQHSVLVTIQF